MLSRSSNSCQIETKNIRSGAIEITSISFFRFDSLSDRLWAFAQMGFARLSMMRLPHAGFWKLLGSGTGEGFTPIPNTSVYAILCTWPNLETARTQTQSGVFRRYLNRAAEGWTLFLTPQSARGTWSGKTPFAINTSPMPGPLVALTRATIKPSILMKFWKRVPDISAMIGKDQNVLFKIGVGEVPWFHQVTFSIWPDETSMASFARHSGPHAQAIKAVRDGNWFAEELYARFSIADQSGSWSDCHPDFKETTT